MLPAPSYGLLKVCSYLHSTVYAVLLAVWLIPGLEGPTFVFGMAHGIGWIVMALLSIAAVQRRVIPLSAAVLIAIVGCVGPFAGSAWFAWRKRRGVESTPAVRPAL